MGGDDPPQSTVDVISAGDDRSGRRRRWPWGLLAIVVAATVAFTPVRDHLKAGQAAHLAQVWARARALDAAQARAESRLMKTAVPTDAPLTRRVLAAVNRQEEARLRGLRSTITVGWPHDAALDQLAAAMRLALDGEITDLANRADNWSTSTARAITRADNLLGVQRDRFHLQRAPRATANYAVADGALQRLRHYLDDPVRWRLLVAAKDGPRVLDLRGSRARAAPVAESINPWAPSIAVAPRGYLTFVNSTTVYTTPLSLTQVRRLGKGWEVFAAARPDGVWIADPPWRRHATVRLVDEHGKALAGPFRIPTGWQLAGLASADGLLLTAFAGPGPGFHSSALALWNPLGARSVHELARGCLGPVAARGHLVTWISCKHYHPLRRTLHLTNTRTGTDRVITNPRGAVPLGGDQPGIAAFSPNGRWLAVYYSQVSGHPSPPGLALSVLGLVDTRTGHARLIPGAPVAGPLGDPGVLWTPDSTRLFYETGLDAGVTLRPYDAAAPFATYRIGDRASVDMRYHNSHARLLAVLPAPHASAEGRRHG